MLEAGSSSCPCHIAETASPPAMSSILASWSSLIHHPPRKDPAKKDLALCSTSTALFETLKNQSPQGIPEHGKPFPTGQACKKQKLNEPRCSSQGAMPSQSSPATVLHHHKVTAESAARGKQTATSSCSSWSSRGSAEPEPQGWEQGDQLHCGSVTPHRALHATNTQKPWPASPALQGLHCCMHGPTRGGPQPRSASSHVHAGICWG